MKYDDGKYHIEQGPEIIWHHEPCHIWYIVNVYGEKCFTGDGVMVYGNEQLAQYECDRLNLMPEGGICTNLI